MSARYVISGAILVALVFGGVAAALLLGTGPAARGNAPVVEEHTEASDPAVKAGAGREQVQPPSAPAPQSLTPGETQPTGNSDADKSARAKYLGQVETGLNEMMEKQSAAYEATAQLASDLEDEGSKWGDDLRAQLKAVVTSQGDVQMLAAKMLSTLNSGKLTDMASEMEQVQRLLTAIMGALGGKEPDVTYLTQVMQDGVTQRLQKMTGGLQAERDRLLLVQEVPPPSAQDGGPLTIRADRRAELQGDRTFTDLNIEPGAKLKLGSGTLTVTGDFRNDGALESSSASLVMSGGNQNFSGNASFQKVRFSGGTKHISAGSSLITTYGENSDKDHPVLVVEAGTTLVIDKDANVNIPNAYGLRVAGTLIIDGGTFHCSFTHGDGKDPGTSSVANNGMNKSWITGCQLIIRSGSFIGDGDASFAGASVYVQGGELRINDDIWGSGDLLEISGGVVSNNSGGGMFALTGQVHLNGGRLEANQYEGRGLYVTKEAEVWSVGGEVVIGGQDVSGAQSGIVLAHDVQLPNLQLTVSSVISTKSPDSTTLSVSGNISIGKGKKLQAQGRRVLGSVETGEEFGEFLP